MLFRTAAARGNVSPTFRVGLSVLATAALMWLVGPTVIVAGLLLFWAVLVALVLAYWRRKTRGISVTAIPLRPIGAPGPTPV